MAIIYCVQVSGVLKNTRGGANPGGEDFFILCRPAPPLFFFC